MNSLDIRDLGIKNQKRPGLLFLALGMLFSSFSPPLAFTSVFRADWRQENCHIRAGRIVRRYRLDKMRECDMHDG